MLAVGESQFTNILVFVCPGFSEKIDKISHFCCFKIYYV